MTGILSSRAALPIVVAAAAIVGAGATWIVQRSMSGDSVRTYLLAHPEVIPEAMQRLQERENLKVLASFKSDYLKPVGTAWSGNAKGDVTIVEFLDYNCGYCKASVPTVNALIKADPGVKVIYREWPVLSDESVLAARYGMALARAGGDYRKLHEALYATAPLTPQGIEGAVRTAGGDPVELKKAFTAPEVDQSIVTNSQLMRQLSQTGTPAWIIGDRVYSGLQSLDDLKAAVAEARKNKSA